jgi:hypothetical protein
LLVLGPLAGGLLAVTARNAGTIRTIIAACAVLILVPLTLRYRRLGIVATVVFLASIGLLRRILIPVAGWSQTDPILLVAPALAVLILASRLRRDEPVALGGPLPALVAALLGLTCLAAGYGLWQTLVGFPSWDLEWIRVGGYTSLQVGVIRGFSVFPSSAEYALCVTAAIMIILAQAMRGRLAALPALPLLVWALVLESSRTMVVQGLVGVLVMGALLAGSVRRMVVILVVGLLAIGLLDQLVAPHLLNVAEDATTDPLIAHEAGGLGDPLNPKQSTAQIHVEQVTSGFLLSLNHPLGLGTAGTNLAGLRVGEDAAVGAEVDIPNEFIGLGILGGLLYVAVVVLALRGAIRLALRHREVVSLGVVGILMVGFGQWLNGGYYAFAPILWLLIGAVARRVWLDSREERADASLHGGD